jgi:ribA/ribD-fused uncharacterized protein
MIDKFDNEYEFLSNFYKSPFIFDGTMWPTMEHFYQAHKATNMADYVSISTAATPSIAKQLGGEIKIRDDWDDVKEGIMLRGLVYKFNMNIDLRDKLVETEGELIEGNKWHDNYWGNCTCDKCKDIEGQNKLGVMLMRIRDMHSPFLNI